MTTYHADLAWLPPGRLARDVRRWSWPTGGFTDVVEGAAPGSGDRLPGLVLPGLANAHSHAFHRALRGRTQARPGAEGRSGPGGTGCTPWPTRSTRTATSRWPGRRTPRWCSRASPRSASSTTCTTARPAPATPTRTRWGTPWSGPPVRPGCASRCSTPATSAPAPGGRSTGCSNGSATATPRPGPTGSRRCARRTPMQPDVVVGAAAHSVRAVPADQLATIAAWAGQHGAPLHAHVSEQQRENDECLAAYGVTPTRLLHDAGPARAALQRGARDPPDRRRRRAARRQRDGGLHVPDDRARPGRRRRPRRAAARGRLAGDPRVGQPCRGRPVRGGPGGRARRAAG